MKVKLLLFCFLLNGCALVNSSSLINSNFDNQSSSISSVSKISNTSENSNIINISSNSLSSNLKTSEVSSSSSLDNENSSSTVFNVCEDKPGGKNEDGSDKLPIPCNKNNKIKIGNSNETMTSFKFKDSLPDYFRAIYGNNFNKGKDLFYSENNGGGYMIKMGGPNNPSKGIQTAMFESNLKLEIRLNIGEMFNNSKGNEVDKDLPVVVIYAFDENGKYLRKVEIEEITMNNKNGTIRKYMNGEDVAYLEIRSLQCAYKSSQGYNYALLGLDLIAWPYPL